jgi:hypothetical protein
MMYAIETFYKGNGFFHNTYFLVFFLIIFFINFYTYSLEAIRIFSKHGEEVKRGTRRVFMVPLILFPLIISYHFFLLHGIWGVYSLLLAPVLIVVLAVMHRLNCRGLFNDGFLSFINTFLIHIGDLYFIHLFAILLAYLFVLNFLT